MRLGSPIPDPLIRASENGSGVWPRVPRPHGWTPGGVGACGNVGTAVPLERDGYRRTRDVPFVIDLILEVV
jgi:hypothetical protein